MQQRGDFDQLPDVQLDEQPDNHHDQPDAQLQDNQQHSEHGTFLFNDRRQRGSRLAVRAAKNLEGIVPRLGWPVGDARLDRLKDVEITVTNRAADQIR